MHGSANSLPSGEAIGIGDPPPVANDQTLTHTAKPARQPAAPAATKPRVNAAAAARLNQPTQKVAPASMAVQRKAPNPKALPVDDTPPPRPNPDNVWPVATSLKATLRSWAQHKGWPAPQFLTQADWVVDVPGTLTGPIESALRDLVEGFSKAPTRPRIEISSNHVMVVSEGASE